MSSWLELGLLGLAAFSAGFVDAIIGGGGLILVPALFGVFPEASAALLFGTNKTASISGTTVAIFRYAGKVPLCWRILIPAIMSAIPCAWLGALTVSQFSKEALRPIILSLLILVALYTLKQRQLGLQANPSRFSRAQEPWVAASIGAALGFYDGFFGPGTGMFLAFLLIRCYGYDFLQAAATTKVINWATNAGALGYFLMHRQVIWEAAGTMAVCNIIGAVLGVRFALRKGNRFIRQAFLGLLMILIGKFIYDTLSLFG